MEVEEVKMTPEVQFAQHLAANNPKIRYRALKKLAKWFRSRACGKPFAFDDLMTIWKGLFYCMWMSDKPLVQEKLADHLCDLIHCFGQSETTLTFIDVFFRTMAREWYGIDKYRIEKFMMLIRRFLRQSFHYLKQQQWKVKPVQDFLEVLIKSVLSPNCDSTPAGLQVHVADIYLEELARVGGDDFKTKKLLIFLQPYCQVMAQTKDSMILTSISKNVFMELVEREEPLFPFQIRHNYIANLLVQNAFGEEVRIENRNAMYNLVGTFRDAAKNIFPSDKINMEVEFGRVISKKEIDEAAKQLLKEKQKVKRDREKWINRRRREKRSKGFDELGSNFQISEVGARSEMFDETTNPGFEGNVNFPAESKRKKKEKEKFLKVDKENATSGNDIARKPKPTLAISPTKKALDDSEKKSAPENESILSISLPEETKQKPENEKIAKVLATKRNWSEMENVPESENQKSTTQANPVTKLTVMQNSISRKKLHKQSKLPKFIVTPCTLKKASSKTAKLFSAKAKFVVTPQTLKCVNQAERSESARGAHSMPNGEQPMKKTKIQKERKSAENSLKNIASDLLTVRASASNKRECGNEKRKSAKSVYDALHKKAQERVISATMDYTDVEYDMNLIPVEYDRNSVPAEYDKNSVPVQNSGERITAAANDSELIINIHATTPKVTWNGSAHPRGNFDGAHKRRVSFATFEGFVKTPPCFFRKSVTKATTPLSGILKKPIVIHSV